jgi:glycosyltransferase involved in cell wall biosynthesis
MAPQQPSANLDSANAQSTAAQAEVSSALVEMESYPFLSSSFQGETMRIARLDFYPSERFPGGGLHGYYLTRHIPRPTLVLARDDRPFRDIPPNADLHAIRYPSPDFSKRINPFKAALKVFGLIYFFIATLPVLLRFRPEIVHIHTPLYIHLAAFAKIFLRSRLCMTFHGSDLYRIKRSSVIKRLLPRLVDRFFYISGAMRYDLEHFIPPCLLTYTPNGVDTELFHNAGQPRKKQLIAVGTLRWQKGYRCLIEAFARLRPQGYRLIIVGEGPERKKLQDLISRNRLGDSVVLAGRKSHREVVDLLNQSEIYVMSSLSEGFPKALLEGIACGLPVVVSDVGNCRELAKGVGLCVTPGDSYELAESMNHMITDQKFRQACASRTHTKALDYSWKKAAGIVEETYEQLIRSKKSEMTG